MTSQDKTKQPSGTGLDNLLLYTGRFYCAAGLAHGLDFATDNVLLHSAGLGSFEALPFVGQAFGVVWVLIGILQLFTSTRAQREAGIVAYGGWELFLASAGFLITNDSSGEMAWLRMAALGQLLLGICYLVTRSMSAAKTESLSDEALSQNTEGQAQRLKVPPRMLAGRQPRGNGNGSESSGGLQQQVEEKLGKSTF